MKRRRRALTYGAAGVLLLAGHLLGRALPTSDRTAAPPVDRASPPAPLVPLPQHQPAADILDALPTAGGDDFPDLLERTMAEKPFQLQHALLIKLFDRWLRVDPAAAFAAVDSRKSKQGRLTGMLFERWALLDPEAALERALAEGVTREMLWPVLRKIASHYPQLFFELAEQYAGRWPEGEPSESHYARAYRALGKSDPSAAFEILASESPPAAAREAAFALAEELIKRDGAGVFEALKAIADPTMRDAAIDHALKILATEDVRAAAAAYEQIIAAGELGNIREEALAKIVGELTKDDPVAAYQWLKTLPAGTKRFGGKWNLMRRAMLTELPADAAQMHAFFSVDEEWKDSVATIGSWTVLEDADRIAAETLQLPQDEIRDALLKTAMRRWAWTGDIEAAILFADGVPDTDVRRDLFTSILVSHNSGRLGERMFEVAEQAGLERIPERAMLNLIESDLEVAMGYVRELSMEHYEDKAALRRVAASAASRDPLQAIEWVEGIEDAEAKSVAIKSALGGWLSYDSIAASEWVTTLPEGRERDSAAAQITVAIAASEPDSALQWGLSIGEAGEREQALQTLARRWASEDPAGAIDGFLNRAPGLDETERAALIEVIQSTEQKKR